MRIVREPIELGPRFKELKKYAEDSLDRFYLQSPKMWDLGYQRSIVVHFSKGTDVGPTRGHETILKVEQHFHPYIADVDDLIKEFQGGDSIIWSPMEGRSPCNLSYKRVPIQ